MSDGLGSGVAQDQPVTAHITLVKLVMVRSGSASGASTGLSTERVIPDPVAKDQMGYVCNAD